jgi:hypothetical protein
MATPVDGTTQSPPETTDEAHLASLIQAADFLEDQINTVKQLLSSRQSVDHLLPQLVEFDKLLRESLKFALKTLEMDDKQMERFRKSLRRSRKLRERVGGMNRRARIGGNLLEGLFACEDLRRRVLGDLFCRDFEELSLGMQGGGDENEGKMGGMGEGTE